MSRVRVAGEVKSYRSPVFVVMSQYFVEKNRTVTTPCDEEVLGVTRAWISTPYGVSLRNCRSTVGQATVASRPTG